MYLPDINSLRNLPYPFPVEEYIIAGYFTSGDGGGGTFTWVVPPTGVSVPIDDKGIIIRNLNNSSGYFKRLYSGPINVRWFGAKGDGIADDTVAVHAARDSEFTKNGGTLYFPKGKYRGVFTISSSVDEVNIIGDGDGSILCSNAAVTSTAVLTLGRHSPDWRFSKVSNITIQGEHLIGVNGIVIDDDTTDPGYAGRWIIENLSSTPKCNNRYKD